MKFKKKLIDDVIGDLPDIKKCDIVKTYSGTSFDLYIQAIGFEERTTAISSQLSKAKNFKVKEAFLIKYPTNLEDNLFYEQTVKEQCKVFSERLLIGELNDDFYNNLKQRLVASEPNSKVKIIIDLSSLSSRLILMFTKILFHFEVELKILYAEGRLYHPTSPESKINSLVQTYGVDRVFISPEYSGGTKESQDLIICFPSFNLERTETIITHIDDFILKQKDKSRLIWIIGTPNLPEPDRTNRQKIQMQINKISEGDKVYYVSTLDYKLTLRLLDHVYNEIHPDYHINISDLGSKMQSLGIGLFGMLRREVSIYYSEPKKYNAGFYSEGVKDYWTIDIGNTTEFKENICSVDTIINLHT